MRAPHPYKIAIVGGIGSGKSVVSRLFRMMGVPVYDCDSEAKRLMNADAALRLALTEAIGAQVYGANGCVDRAFLASYMFGHPHFAAWAAGAGAPIVAVETAILFESGMDADVDAIVMVYASEELRLRRAMQRDGADEQSVRRRMSNQMAQEERLARATWRIGNDDTGTLIAQVRRVIGEISEERM